MWAGIGAAAIMGGSSLLGGILGSKSQSAASRLEAQLAREQMDLQKEFAQKSIQWKVADAQKAGLHPLAALGTSSASYSPVSTNIEPIDYSWLGDVGQNINRAIQQGKDAKERKEAQDLENKFNFVNLRKANAEADYWEAQAANERFALQQQLFPPSPKVNDMKPLGSPDNAPNIYGDRVHNLYSLASFGDIMLSVLNPDIADSLTESQFSHLTSIAAREIEHGRNPQALKDAFAKLPKAKQKAVVDGRAIFEYVPAAGVYMVTYPKKWSKDRREVSGKLRLE